MSSKCHIGKTPAPGMTFKYANYMYTVEEVYPCGSAIHMSSACQGFISGRLVLEINNFYKMIDDGIITNVKPPDNIEVIGDGSACANGPGLKTECKLDGMNVNINVNITAVKSQDIVPVVGMTYQYIGPAGCYADDNYCRQVTSVDADNDMYCALYSDALHHGPKEGSINWFKGAVKNGEIVDIKYPVSVKSGSIVPVVGMVYKAAGIRVQVISVTPTADQYTACDFPIKDIGNTFHCNISWFERHFNDGKIDIIPVVGMKYSVYEDMVKIGREVIDINVNDNTYLVKFADNGSKSWSGFGTFQSMLRGGKITDIQYPPIVAAVPKKDIIPVVGMTYKINGVERKVMYVDNLSKEFGFNANDGSLQAGFSFAWFSGYVNVGMITDIQYPTNDYIIAAKDAEIAKLKEENEKLKLDIDSLKTYTMNARACLHHAQENIRNCVENLNYCK